MQPRPLVPLALQLHAFFGQTPVASTVQKVVCAHMLLTPCLLGLAIGNPARGPSVLANACNADAGLRAFILGPPCISLGVEPEDVGGPQLLLTLGAPALLPGPVSSLRCQVPIMLRRDRAMLPAIPLPSASPRWCARIADQHALAHDELDGATAQLDGPGDTNNKNHRAHIVPGCHVDVRQGIVPNGLVVTILLLLLQLLLCLGWCNHVHDMLESIRQPRGCITCSTAIEEATTGLLRLVVRLH